MVESKEGAHPETRVWALDENEDPIAPVEGFQSVEVQENLYDYDHVILKAPPVAPGLKQLIQDASFVVVTGVDRLFLPEIIDQDTNRGTVNVTCVDVSAWFEERRIQPPTGEEFDEIENQPAETRIKHYVSEHAGSSQGARSIPGMSIALDQGRGLPGSNQERWRKLLEVIKGIGEDAGVGWRITQDREFEVIVGEDKTESVFFDLAFDSVQAQRRIRSDRGSKTFVWVGGPNEGILRAIVERWTGVSEPTGFDRREAFIDARDVEWDDALEARGDEFLAENGPEASFECDVLPWGPFRRGEHWDLGDEVLGRNQAWGVEEALRVISVKTIASGQGPYRVTATLGRPWPTVEARLAVREPGSSRS